MPNKGVYGSICAIRKGVKQSRPNRVFLPTKIDLFSASAPQAVDLRTTPIPALNVAADQVGSPAQWAALTLSQVLVKWEDLYSDFIAVLDGPIELRAVVEGLFSDNLAHAIGQGKACGPAA